MYRYNKGCKHYEANLLGTDAMVQTPHHQIQRRHPLRSPAWRWERAQWLLDRHFHFSRLRDDELTGRTLRYLRQLSRPHQYDLARAVKRDPDLAGAHRLYESDGAEGVLIEARLLMGQDSAEIERLMGVPASVVDLYEAVFFQCHDRLQARDWVVCCALGTPPSGASIGPDKGALLKRFAFFGGPLVLDAVQPYLLGGKDLFEPPLDLATPEGRREQIVRLAVAVHLLPHDAATQWKLQKIMLLVQERDRQSKNWRWKAALAKENRESQDLERDFSPQTGPTRPEMDTPPAPSPPEMGQLAQAG
jgi:hypothetical protein